MVEMLKRIKRIVKRFVYSFNRLYYNTILHSVGADTLIKKPLRIVGGQHISVGSNSMIMDGIRIEAIDAWKDRSYDPCITLGSDVNIGQNCHITCASRVSVGDGVSIMPQVLVTDIEHEYIPGKRLDETGLRVGHVEIGDYSVIGMGARIMGGNGLTIGKNVVIGANSVVTASIPDNSIAVGAPARVIRRNNGGKDTASAE